MPPCSKAFELIPDFDVSWAGFYPFSRVFPGAVVIMT
jgi:hypothetical protein